MIRLNLVLMLAIVASAVYLVGVQYDSRRLYTELDKARSESRRLETEFERLEPSRVERLAREKLQMHQTTPAITTYVTYSSSVPVASATQGTALRSSSGKVGAP